MNSTPSFFGYPLPTVKANEIHSFLGQKLKV